MKDKALLFELIIVLILVSFGLWSLYKERNSVPATNDSITNSQGVAPENLE